MIGSDLFGLPFCEPPTAQEPSRKEVYIVGKTKDGRWAGLKTSVVET